MSRMLCVADDNLHGGSISVSSITRLRVDDGYWNKSCTFDQENCERFAEVPTRPTCGDDDKRTVPTVRVGRVHVVRAYGLGYTDGVVVDSWPTLALAQERLSEIAKMVEKERK